MKKQLLASVLLVAMLASCGAATNTDTATTTVAQAEQTTAEVIPEDRSYKDDLPDTLDYKGIELGIVSSTGTFFNGKMTVPTLDDVETILDQAMYDRARFVEDRLNVKFVEHLDKSANLKSLIAQCVQAGDTTYDIAHMADRVVFNLGLDGCMAELGSLKYLDLSKKYWMQDGNEIFNLFGKQYAAYGELSTGTYDYAHVLAFNQQMLTDYKLTSPYDYVKDDKWTFDRFGEMIQTTVKDLNGDGTMDDKDQYGFHTRNGFLFPLMYTAAGFKTVKIGDDGTPEFNMKGNQDFEDIYDWCTENFLDSKAWYVHTAGNDFLTKQPLFQNGQVLFSDMTFFTLGQVREMETDFGIVPYPKYTEDQSRYYTWCEGGAKAIGATITCTSKNAEAVGATLEALCSYSYEGVIPVYYEINLKMKYSRDEVSTQMFDIIRDSRAFDLGDNIWSETIRDVFNRPLYQQTPLASLIASNEEGIRQNIADTVAKLKK